MTCVPRREERGKRTREGKGNSIDAEVDDSVQGSARSRPRCRLIGEEGRKGEEEQLGGTGLKRLARALDLISMSSHQKKVRRYMKGVPTTDAPARLTDQTGSDRQ